jgi:ketosteroid isomerase-like protein
MTYLITLIENMKKIIAVLIFLCSFTAAFAQGPGDLQRLVDTEKSFAKMAAERNTKEAFLTFLADDGITFNPGPGNGKETWNKRSVTPALLTWTPEYADISANGILGYTTGPWEYRAKGKDDVPSAFGHYVTLWQKQTDGNFRAVLDIGISHDKVALADNYGTAKGATLNNKKISAADSSTMFFEIAEKDGLNKAYRNYLADDVRLYREGKAPFVGKKNASEAVKKESRVKFGKRSIFINAGDLAYLSNSYAFLDEADKETEKGNFLQIWKFRGEKWQIVLDLFNPLPAEKK